MFDFIFRAQTLWWFLLLLYVPSCIGLIVIVLLQKGKGVGFAGAFGIGPGSDTVFGPRMSKSLPAKATYVMVALFLTVALVMSLVSKHLVKGAAPDRVGEEAVMTQAESEQDALMTGLDELGIGTAVSSETGSEPSGSTPSNEEESVIPVDPGEDANAFGEMAGDDGQQDGDAAPVLPE